MVATWFEFCPEIRRKTKTIAFCCDFFSAKFERRPKTKQNKVFTPVCAIFIRLIEMKTKAKRFYLTIFCLWFCCAIYVLFCAIFDNHNRRKTKQIRKKKVFSAYPVGGTLNFPLEVKSRWGDANYRWGDVSFLQFKYWLYFHSQFMALFHYCDAATRNNQHQLLTCKTSK